MAGAMLGEPSHISRVVVPADYTAAADREQLYRTQGQIWKLVVPKADVIPDLFTSTEARRVMTDAGTLVDWAGYEPDRALIILTAVGAYQLGEVLAASRRLAERGVAHRAAAASRPISPSAAVFNKPCSVGKFLHSN